MLCIMLHVITVIFTYFLLCATSSPCTFLFITFYQPTKCTKQVDRVAYSNCTIGEKLEPLTVQTARNSNCYAWIPSTAGDFWCPMCTPAQGGFWVWIISQKNCMRIWKWLAGGLWCSYSSSLEDHSMQKKSSRRKSTYYPVEEKRKAVCMCDATGWICYLSWQSSHKRRKVEQVSIIQNMNSIIVNST